MKFYDRKTELQELKTLKRISTTKSVILVITGVRRVGKTELIKHFFEKNKGIYLYVDHEKTEKELLHDFMDVLTKERILPRFTKLESLEELLTFLYTLAKKKHIMIAIDEFQRFLRVNPSFLNQMQKQFDLNKEKTNLFFMLTGSSMGMIKTIFQDKGSPLFGRSHNMITIKPFDFQTINTILKDIGIESFEMRIMFYCLFGGIPKYYVLLNDYKCTTVEHALKILLLRDIAPLAKEVSIIITETFGKEARTYHGILTAIALGKTTSNEIAQFADIKETSISPYLHDLIETLGLVEKRYPVTVTKPWKSKKGIYVLTDSFFKFWFKFIFRNSSLYEGGAYDALFEKIKKELNAFIGKNFEGLCKELFNLYSKQQGWSYTTIGSWWSRRGEEIDVVALNEEGKNIVFGECKWQTQVNARKLIVELKTKSKFVEWQNQTRNEVYVLFARSFREKIDSFEGKKVYCFDIDDLKKIVTG